MVPCIRRGELGKEGSLNVIILGHAPTVPALRRTAGYTHTDLKQWFRGGNSDGRKRQDAWRRDFVQIVCGYRSLIMEQMVSNDVESFVQEGQGVSPSSRQQLPEDVIGFSNYASNAEVKSKEQSVARPPFAPSFFPWANHDPPSAPKV